MPSYRQYRNWGHPPLRAWVLSVHPALWYGSAALLGVVVAFVIAVHA